MKTLNSLVAGGIMGLALTAIQGLSQSTYTPYSFTTLAGSPSVGNADGTGSAARFYGAVGVAVDGAGNVYVADDGDHTIRKVTSARVVTTLAGVAGSSGSADGVGSTARFFEPSSVAVDGAGNVYVADTGNNTIRKIYPPGLVTTVAGLAGSMGSADGTGIAALFYGPLGVAVDSVGNLYVADSGNNTIRKVTPAGVVTTLAGVAGNSGSADGTGSGARFRMPRCVGVDGSGNVYVADTGNNTIRKVTRAGVVTTLAGVAGNSGSADGTGKTAQFNSPKGVAADSIGNLYVADTGNHTIRKVTSAGVVTTLAGVAGYSGSADGTGSAAHFNYPYGVAVDGAGNAYVADSGNKTIRKVTPAGVVTTLAGSWGDGSADGTGIAARFWLPRGVAVDGAGNVYVADSGNNTIRKVTSAGVVATLAGVAGSSGSADGVGNYPRLSGPSGVAVDGAANVYVADTGNNTIRRIYPSGLVTTVAGLAGSMGSADGTGIAARFYGPLGVAVDSVGSLYVADAENNTIRKVTPAGVVTTLAGVAGSSGSADGVGSTARFSHPSSVAVDGAGNVYVADTGNDTIRKIYPSGLVTTLAGVAGNVGSADGTGKTAQFSSPYGVAVDGAGNVFVADYSNNTIREGYPENVPALIDTFSPGFGFNGGEFGFLLSGPAGQMVVVEASTDLVNWLPIWTNTFAGARYFSDPQSGVFSQRFYRARTP